MRKKTTTFLILAVLLLCLLVLVSGAMKASLMGDISDAGMTLRVDSSNISAVESKLYKWAYSSPVAADQVGLWLEALLAKKFETFSSDGEELSVDFARKLRGWPLNKTIEIDLSGSGTSNDAIDSLGSLDSLEWLDLSGTQVTSATISSLLYKTPNLKKLQLQDTNIAWNPGLVDELLNHTGLKTVEVDEQDLPQTEWARLKTALDSRP